MLEIRMSTFVLILLAKASQMVKSKFRGREIAWVDPKGVDTGNSEEFNPP